MALIVAARQTGSSTTKVLDAVPIRSGYGRGSMFTNRQVECRDGLISYKNRRAFPVSATTRWWAARPDNAGQWGIIPMGFFGRLSPSWPIPAFPHQIVRKLPDQPGWASNMSRREAKVDNMKRRHRSMYRYSQEMRASRPRRPPEPDAKQRLHELQALNIHAWATEWVPVWKGHKWSPQIMGASVAAEPSSKALHSLTTIPG